MVPKTEKHGKIPENAAKIPFPKVPLNNHLYEYNLGRTYSNTMHKLSKPTQL